EPRPHDHAAEHGEDLTASHLPGAPDRLRKWHLSIEPSPEMEQRFSEKPHPDDGRRYPCQVACMDQNRGSQHEKKVWNHDESADARDRGERESRALFGRGENEPQGLGTTALSQDPVERSKDGGEAEPEHPQNELRLSPDPLHAA